MNITSGAKLWIWNLYEVLVYVEKKYIYIDLYAPMLDTWIRKLWLTLSEWTLWPTPHICFSFLRLVTEEALVKLISGGHGKSSRTSDRTDGASPKFPLECPLYTGQVQHLACPSVTFYLRFVFKAASHIARMRSGVNFQRFPVETSVLLAALRYKPEGRSFVSRWGHWKFFHWFNLAGRTMALWSTQPLNWYEDHQYFLGVKAAGA